MGALILLEGEASEAILKALRSNGYRKVFEDGQLAALTRSADACTVCCAAAGAVGTLQKLYAGSGSQRGLYRFVIRSIERPLFESVLERTGGNQVAAAAILGISRNTLRSRMRQLDIQVPARGRGGK
jgi:DNA-binding protein Fis